MKRGHPPKQNKENTNKKFFKEKNKVLLKTWDDSESFEDGSKDEQANMTLMASTRASESESGSDTKWLFSHSTHCEL